MLQEQAIDALDIFYELIECEVTVLVPHVKNVIEFCMEVNSILVLLSYLSRYSCIEIVLFCCKIGKDARFGDNLRIKAMAFIMCVIRVKRKLIIKLKLVPPLLNWLFPIMCTMRGDEDEEDLLFDDNEASSPAALAAQVRHAFALSLCHVDV